MENIFPSRISLVNNIIGVVQPVTLNKWLRNFLKIGNLHIKNLVCGKEEIQEKVKVKRTQTAVKICMCKNEENLRTQKEALKANKKAVNEAQTMF